jgi:hypothetical protein
MTLVRRIARFLHPIGAAAIVFLVFVQVYLIADYIFGNAGVLNTHEVIGRVVVGVELILLVTARIGWWRNWAQMGASAALFLIGALQAELAKDIGNSPSVHAFHGMLAFAVFAIAWWILVQTRDDVRTLGAA